MAGMGVVGEARQGQVGPARQGLSRRGPGKA
jgi:hypothetical protein